MLRQICAQIDKFLLHQIKLPTPTAFLQDQPNFSSQRLISAELEKIQAHKFFQSQTTLSVQKLVSRELAKNSPRREIYPGLDRFALHCLISLAFDKFVSRHESSLFDSFVHREISQELDKHFPVKFLQEYRQISIQLDKFFNKFTKLSLDNFVLTSAI